MHLNQSIRFKISCEHMPNSNSPVISQSVHKKMTVSTEESFTI